MRDGIALRVRPGRLFVGEARWGAPAITALIGLYAIGLGYLVATHPLGSILLAIGVPAWLVGAYRFPIVGIAVLAAGEFLLRTVVGTFGDLSRGVSGPGTIVTGTILLLPLVAACLAKGDLRRIGEAFRDHPAVVWSLVAVTIAVVVGFAVAPSSYGGLKLEAYIGLNLPLFVFPLVLVRSERDARTLLVAVVAVSVVTLASSLAGSASVWSQSALRGTKAAVGQLADQRIDVGIWFARRIALGALAAVALLFMTRIRPALLYWTAAAVLLAGAVLAASRGPVLGILLALGVMMALPGRAMLRQGARTVVILALAVSAVVGLAYLPSQFADRYTTTFSLQDPSLQGRLDDVHLSMRLIGERPLTGVGLGHYPIALWGVDRIIYPHNLLLEMATELGIPVALLLLLMVWGGLRLAARGARNAASPWVRALGLWAVGVALMSFFGAELSGDLRTNEHVWMAAGVALAVARLMARTPEGITAPRVPVEVTDA